MFLIFDTETTGLPKNYKAPVTDSDNWPRMVQLAWQLHDNSGKLLQAKNYIVKPDGYDIPIGVSKIHGITTERAERDGHDLKLVLEELKADLEREIRDNYSELYDRDQKSYHKLAKWIIRNFINHPRQRWQMVDYLSEELDSDDY